MLELTEIYSRISSVTRLMYHGTSKKNLPAILSEGLIPDPRKRVWDQDTNVSFHQPSRQSLGGVYLTTNLMTALSSAGKDSKGNILVVVSVQTGNLLADEDDLKYLLNDITLPGLSINDYMIRQIYLGWYRLTHDLIEEDWRRQEAASLVQRAREGYVAAVLERVERALKGGLTAQERSLAVPLLQEGFLVALARQAAYVEAGWDDRAEWEAARPDRGAAEAAFKRLEDRLTRLWKRLGRPEHRTRDFGFTTRLDLPIRYNGKNKILAVVEELSYESGIGTRVRVLYPASGQVPTQLIRDWEQAVGPWRVVA